MQKIECRLTVLFSDPFWAGVYERIIDGQLEVYKITFPSEPKGYDVLTFLLQNHNQFKFSPPVKWETKSDIKINPKRRQRQIQKQLESTCIGTKAQQAMKLMQTEQKEARKKFNRLERNLEKERHYSMKQEKKKKKHKGR